MMTAFLSWVLNIVLRAAAVTVLWIVIRTIVRSGGGTLRLIFETIGTAIRCGCLKVRLKLTETLRKDAEKEETEEEEPKGPGIKVTGTVI